MTQDVQPLTWQKRTNLEEHQQFFSKINEIIDNLAPTVEEADQAIAHAIAAIASADDAIATANAASAEASAAASQAQTAASTVAGYDSRLTADEGNIAANADNITALQGVQGDYVKKAGADQTVTSRIMVPTTATGTRDTQIVNGTRIQNDLDAYAPMIRTTGNQTKTGIMTFARPIIGTFGDWHNDHSVTNKWVLYGKFKTSGAGRYIKIDCIQASNTAVCAGAYIIGLASHTGIFLYRKSVGSNDPLTGTNDFAVVQYQDDWYLAVKKTSVYGALIHRIDVYSFYGDVITDEAIEWLPVAPEYVFDDEAQFTTVNHITD